MASASEKKEDVKSKLRELRKDLRVIHTRVTEETVMPEPEEVRAAMTQLEALLAVIEPKSAKKSKSKASTSWSSFSSSTSPSGIESSHHLLGNASRVADGVLDGGVLATQAGYPTLKAGDEAISGERYQTNSEQ